MNLPEGAAGGKASTDHARGPLCRGRRLGEIGLSRPSTLRCLGRSLCALLGDLFSSRAIFLLAFGAEVILAGAHDMVEERPGHTPIGVLVRSHMVVVMPGKMVLRPFGILMGFFMDAIVVRDPREYAQRQAWRDAEKRNEGEGDRREGERFLALCVEAGEERPFIVRIAKFRESARAVVFMKMEGPEGPLFHPLFMEKVAMSDPLSSIFGNEACDESNDHGDIMTQKSRFDQEEYLTRLVWRPK